MRTYFLSSAASSPDVLAESPSLGGLAAGPTARGEDG